MTRREKPSKRPAARRKNATRGYVIDAAQPSETTPPTDTRVAVSSNGAPRKAQNEKRRQG
jgi:hypothetical protein